MLHHGLCPVPEVTEIFQADAIDAVGLTTRPAQGDKPRHVQKDGSRAFQKVFPLMSAYLHPYADGDEADEPWPATTIFQDALFAR